MLEAALFFSVILNCGAGLFLWRQYRIIGSLIRSDVSLLESDASLLEASGNLDIRVSSVEARLDQLPMRERSPARKK